MRANLPARAREEPKSLSERRVGTQMGGLWIPSSLDRIWLLANQARRRGEFLATLSLPRRNPKAPLARCPGIGIEMADGLLVRLEEEREEEGGWTGI